MKTILANVRVTPDEMAQWKARARAEGLMTLTAWIKGLVLEASKDEQAGAAQGGDADGAAAEGDQAEAAVQGYEGVAVATRWRNGLRGCPR